MSPDEAAKAKGLPDKFVYPGGKRRTLNIDTGNLLIEAYLRTEKGHTSGTVAGKMGQSGYALLIDADGKARLAIAGGGDREGFASHAPVNDGKWRHVLAEFDRGNHTVRIYVDGKASGEFESKLPTDASLANTEDFLVGKDGSGNHFAGDLDFLRVCRGTLADAQTTIEELYAWQFDGPFLGDLAGNRRDWNAGPAGALGR